VKGKVKWVEKGEAAGRLFLRTGEKKYPYNSRCGACVVVV